jgi:hypothetical protein
VTAIVTWCLLFSAILAYRVVCSRDNASREKTTRHENVQLDGKGQVDLDKSGAAKSDLTDSQDPSFRFSL